MTTPYVDCSWQRKGVVSTDTLPIARHGAALPIPELLRIIAAECHRMQAGRVHDVCGVHCRGLGPVSTESWRHGTE
jgi:hypothetical protein